MKRFILLTFGFMGWAFYEMSDGGDFESASDRMARLQPAPEVVVASMEDPTPTLFAEPKLAIVDTTPPQNATPPQSEEVTRVSLNLTTLEDAREEVAQIATVDPVTGVAINVGLTTSSTDTPAIIPSLITPNDTGAAVQSALLEAVDTGDIRRVSGNRVNVRGGPGTNFEVVTRLVRGDAVEIIQDNGNGWVLMRPVDGGTEGWMADFLLTSG